MNRWFLEQTQKGNVYHSHVTAAKAVTALSATHTGIALENPLGSNQDFVIESICFTDTVLAGISEVGVGIGPALKTVVSASTTATVIHNGKLAGSNRNIGIGLPYSVATLASTPVWLHPIGSPRITGAVEGYSDLTKKFEGTLISAPGMFVCLMALTVVRTGHCSITWAEVDVLTEEEIPLL